MDNEKIVSDAISQIARSAEVFAAQANVGGMETAGGIVSFLARNPEWTGAFFKRGSLFDLPDDWIERGCLTWHAQNGKIVHPDYARRARIVSKLAKQEPSA